MDTVNLLEQLANSTYSTVGNHQSNDAGYLIQAIYNNDVETVQNQFGDIGFLANLEGVASV